MSKNAALNKAKQAKNDEFFTKIEEIEKELQFYTDFLKDKTIYCNCDDFRVSAFVSYFKNNFEKLAIKQVFATNLDTGKGAYKWSFDGKTETIEKLNGNGDFRSLECSAMLEESDVVVSNPPFSLFRDFFSKLIEKKKQFLIVGSLNAVTYKNIFPHIQKNSVWLGHNQIRQFLQPDNTIKRFGHCVWFTNIGSNDREPLDLCAEYPAKLVEYDNHNAVDVGSYRTIPKDYNGVVGVPVSFLMYHCPRQFEIVGFDNSPLLNGKRIYKRIFVKYIIDVTTA